MFTPRLNAAQAYSKVGVETGVEAASPHQLIVMLFDGALLAISTAGIHMQQQNINEKGQSISRAIDIITSGLKASLDKSKGGELAQNLDALYDYMCTRLLQANLRNDKSALDEVSRLLNDIRGAWVEIAAAPAVKAVSTSTSSSPAVA
ncbi:MAG: flagellar export chaperone FliS [Sterolibacterium sp.]|nr:flagellar export chaperone FliS [Sterolibacterium sp.]